MNPCQFGRPAAPLFGIYRPPRVSVARNAGVLLCPPIGLEYLRTHYAIRLLAKQLAAVGFHVLRFDYHGTGDSSGEVGTGQFQMWVDDVVLAARELADICGAADLTMVGLRMGAVFALEALARQGAGARGIVLWDPVVDGADYLAALESMHLQMGARRAQVPPSSDELLGARYPEDLRMAIRRVDLAEEVGQVRAGGAALVVSEDRPEYGVLLSRLRREWPDTGYRLVADPVDWRSVDAAYDARFTGPIVRTVAEVTESLN
jgi:uncharacterized protein